MAKLTAMPHEAMVSYFKGVLDYYVYKGTPVVRKWPHWPKRQAHGAELANQQAFAYANAAWKTLNLYVRRMFIHMSAGTSLAPRDIFLRGYLNGNPF